MDQKELEIQRALGTLNTYNITIQFPRREEPIGLDQLMLKICPASTRYIDGNDSNFHVEMPSSYLNSLIHALTDLIVDQQNYKSHTEKGMVWVYVHELVNGKFIHITNFRIGG